MAASESERATQESRFVPSANPPCCANPQPVGPNGFFKRLPCCMCALTLQIGMLTVISGSRTAMSEIRISRGPMRQRRAVVGAGVGLAPWLVAKANARDADSIPPQPGDRFVHLT